MAISMVAALALIRDQIATITSISSVYSAGDTDTGAIPEALNDLPAAIIYPGPDTEPYELVNGWHTHTYEVAVQLFEQGVDTGERAASLAPMVDRIIEAMALGVKLGGSVTYCLFRRSSGFVTLEYGGVEYLGYEVTLEVKESALVSPVA